MEEFLEGYRSAINYWLFYPDMRFILNPTDEEKIILWLISERQYTPDQAIDQIENFPMTTYFLYRNREKKGGEEEEILNKLSYQVRSKGRKKRKFNG